MDCVIGQPMNPKGLAGVTQARFTRSKIMMSRFINKALLSMFYLLLGIAVANCDAKQQIEH